MYEYLLIRFFNVTQFIVKRNSSGGKEREIYSKLPTYGFVLEMNCGYTTLTRSI